MRDSSLRPQTSEHAGPLSGNRFWLFSLELYLMLEKFSAKCQMIKHSAIYTESPKNVCTPWYSNSTSGHPFKVHNPKWRQSFTYKTFTALLIMAFSKLRHTYRKDLMQPLKRCLWWVVNNTGKSFSFEVKRAGYKILCRSNTHCVRNMHGKKARGVD